MDIIKIRNTIFWWVGCWAIITGLDCVALYAALFFSKRNRRHWIIPKGGERNADT